MFIAKQTAGLQRHILYSFPKDWKVFSFISEVEKSEAQNKNKNFTFHHKTFVFPQNAVNHQLYPLLASQTFGAL